MVSNGNDCQILVFYVWIWDIFCRKSKFSFHAMKFHHSVCVLSTQKSAWLNHRYATTLVIQIQIVFSASAVWRRDFATAFLRLFLRTNTNAPINIGSIFKSSLLSLPWTFQFSNAHNFLLTSGDLKISQFRSMCSVDGMPICFVWSVHEPRYASNTNQLSEFVLVHTFHSYNK